MLYNIRDYQINLLFNIYDKLIGKKYDKKKYIVLTILHRSESESSQNNKINIYQCDIFKI